MWFSACNELLLFLFGAGSLLCWLLAGRAGRSTRRGGWALEAVSVAAFGLALVSKESAVIWLPLFLLAAAEPDWRRSRHPAAAARRAGGAGGGVGLVHAGVLVSFLRRQLFAGRAFLDHLAAQFRAPAVGLGMAGAGRHRVVPRIRSVEAGAGRRWRGSGSASRRTVFSPIRPRFPAARPMSPAPAWPFCSDWRWRGSGAASAGAARKLAAVAAVAMVVSNVGYLWTKKRAQFLRAGRAHRATHPAGPPDAGTDLGAMLPAQPVHRRGSRARGRRPLAGDPGLEPGRGRGTKSGGDVLLHRA